MFNMDFLHQSSLRGTTLCAANYHACIAIPTWCRFCFDLYLHLACFQGHVSHRFSLSIFTDWYRFVCGALQKLWCFNKLSCMYCNAHMMQMCTSYFWPWPPFNLFPRSRFTWIYQSSLMCITLCSAASKSYIFSTNVWPWPPFILSPRSCLTWIFFINFIDRYHFVCIVQQTLCLFNKLSCIYCNTHLM